jgi:DNA gyrase subunit A
MSTTPTNRIPVNIEDEMKRSYMDYAMSVIIGRALPDIRDGLKPAHRRVLYGMKTMGLTSTRGYRKCAKIVGEVMGNFHPHGDASIYDTLVRMAQDFNMRYVLTDGQGNFGSIDGDPPAAMRYTEARLDPLADEMMADLDKETVDFVPNYDETTDEPVVLPATYPNLLVNGSAGIAVGMATNVPPHNLREVVNAVIWSIEASQSATPPTAAERQRKLLELVPGPDFPTGAYIIGQAGIRQAQLTGRGSVLMRAKTEIEISKKGDRSSIVVTAIPYQVNKARLIERIAELVREKTIEGISDIRDESDRDGMRIAIDLKRGEVSEVILNNLYKHTQLQTSFGVIMLAIVGGRPKILTLVEFIDNFIEFRREVVRRRTEFELRKAEARAHILEGLKIALDHLDQVIALIRASKSPVEAREGLMTTFGLSQIQSQAILDMQLQRLTGLERQKILDELAEILKLIERLRAILSSDKLLLEIIVSELRHVVEKFGDDRRTEILPEEGEFRALDLIVEEDMAITVTNTGYIKRTAITNYRNQRRGGKGRIGMRTREEDFVSHLFVASTHAYIMIFSDRGRAYWLKVHEIPDVGPDGRGKAIANLVSMQEGERIAALLTVREFEENKFIVMGTKLGEVKKTELSAFSNPRAGGIIAMDVEQGDSVIAVQVSEGSNEVFIGTRNGMSIRFHETRRAFDGPDGGRGARHRTARPGRSGGHGGAAARRDHSVGHRAGLRQAHRAGRIPAPDARRRRHHQHPGQRPQRQGDWRRAGDRRRRADAHHAAGQDSAYGVEGHPHNRPRHAGRAPHRHRGRRSRSVDCTPGREGRRGHQWRQRRRTRAAGRRVVVGAAFRRPVDYAGSSFANLARSVFGPTDRNRTTSLTSSSSGSSAVTVPTPNVGCRTRRPTLRPFGTD